MRILWVGNAPWTSGGYGAQAGLFIPRLQHQGHDIAVLCNYGLAGGTMNLDGVTYYPGNGNWANHVIATFAKEHEADQIIVLHDAWVMNPDMWKDAPPVAIWAPIDHWPIPPAVLAVLQQVQPIAMSRFGHYWMDKFRLDAPYIPHGVDTNVFKPQPEIKAQVRASLEIPEDAFLVGMVAANANNPNEPDRKSFAKSLDAFWRFAHKRDDAYLYCHTLAAPVGGGHNLQILAAAIGIPEDRLKFPDPDVWHVGLGRHALAQIYNGFDVLLNPSMGEGFGVPILEAQACGVPVIVSDHSAMSELCQAGWMVDGDRKWDPIQLAWFFDPYVPGIVHALELAHEQAREPHMRDAAVEFAAGYDADVVAESYWKPALEAIGATRTASHAPTGAAGRAERRRAARAARKQQPKGVTA